MRQQLNIVRGAVSKKDLIPVLTSFHIYDGRIQGTNGFVVIDTKCDDLKGINITIPAERFIKAVDACQGEPEMKLTETNLIVKSGKLKVNIPLMAHTKFPKQKPESKAKGIGKVLDVLRMLSPFVGGDASRAWACSILFQGDYAYATNNVVIARMPCKTFEEGLMLPTAGIDELLRLNVEPNKIWIEKSWVGFHLGDANDTWIKCRLKDGEWPDVDALLKECSTVVPKELLADVETLTRFVNKNSTPIIRLGERVELQDTSAGVEGYKLPKCLYRAEPFTAMLRVATHADFQEYPAPVPFKGKDGLIGAIVGMIE